MRINNPQNMNGEPLLTGIVTSGVITGDGTPEHPLTVNTSGIQVQIDSSITADGENAVQGGAIYTALEGKADLVSGTVPPAQLPVATTSALGVVKANTGQGITVDGNGWMSVNAATAGEITNRVANKKPVVPSNLNHAVTAALTDSNHLTMTAEQQATAKSVLGVVVDSSLSSLSVNPVANSAVTIALSSKADLSGGKVVSSQIPDLSSTYVAVSTANVSNGYARLDADGKVPTSLLPSYVSDVFEGYLISGVFRKTNSSSGEVIDAKSNAIYVDKATEKTYRWSGSQYTEISKSLALGTTSETAYPGDSGAALASAVASNSNAISGLQTTVAGKADSATVTDLSTRVGALEDQTVTLDTELSSTSTNGVQNKAIDSAIKKRLPTYSSTANGRVLVSVSGGAAVSASNFTVNSTSAMGSSTTVIPNEAAVAGKLAGYAVSSHTHTKSQITDFSHTHAQSDVTGLEDALAGKASSVHSHSQSEVTGLATALAGKAAASHTHIKSQITDFSHTHVQSDVTGLVDALAGKAASSHTHTKSEITDFSHTHAIADVTGLQSALDGKQAEITSSNKLSYSFISGAPEGPTTSLTSTGTNAVQAKTIYSAVEGAKTYADTKMAKVSSATVNDLAKLNASGEVVDAGVSVQTSGALDSSGTKVAVNSVVSAAIQSALSAMSWQAL